MRQDKIVGVDVWTEVVLLSGGVAILISLLMVLGVAVAQAAI
jgi:hypothetical protein